MEVTRQERFPRALSYESVIGPAYDQGSGGSCVGFVLAALVAFYSVWSLGRPLTAQAGTLYKLCKAVDGMPASIGTFLRSGMDILVSGVPTLEKTPFQIRSYKALDTLEAIKGHLVYVGPFPLGIPVDRRAMLQLSSANPVLNPSTPYDCRHAVVVVGFDDARAALRCRNSYGPRWADSGHFWLPFEYLEGQPFNAWGVIL